MKINDNKPSLFLRMTYTLGLITTQSLVEKSQSTDYELIKFASRDVGALDTWDYFINLYDNNKISREFIKDNLNLFRLSFLLTNDFLTFEECEQGVPTNHFHLTRKQLEEAPLLFVVNHQTKCNIDSVSCISKSGHSSITMVLFQYVYGQPTQLGNLVIENRGNIYHAPIAMATQFELMNGKFYFDGNTHNFDLDFDEELWCEIKSILGLVYNSINKNAAIKLNQPTVTGSQSPKDTGMSPLMAGAIGLGVGLVANEIVN